MKKTARVAIEHYPKKGHPENCFIIGEVWASREDICSAKLLNKPRNTFGISNGHKDKVIAEIEWDDKNIGPEDFVFVHYKRRSLDGRRIPRKERFELLAGTRLPDWANFPAEWARWVEEMYPLAVEWLCEWAKTKNETELVDQIKRADKAPSKNDAWDLWNAVDEYVRDSGYLRRVFRRKRTWTSISAIPVKMAMALGWSPPKPKPTWVYERAGVRVIGPQDKNKSD